MIITYIFRNSGISIEKVFDTITKEVACRVGTIRKEKLRYYRFWPIGLLINTIKYTYKSYTSKNLFHITGDVHYLGCLMNKKNTILTIHDAVPLHDKNVAWYSRILCYWLWFYFPLKRLKYITCISEATKDDLAIFFPWAKDKLIVIPNPVGEDFQYHPVVSKQRPVLLHIGTRENKNLPRVIQAIDGLNVTLRIVGKLSEDQYKLLQIHNIRYESLYNISDKQIVEEYINSDIVSFPSLFEGFGMPIIEGQAIGRPVITSILEPMKSVAGNAAILVDPENVYSIRKGIVSLLHNKVLYDQIVKKGRINAEKFLRANIAKQYIDLYEQINNRL